MALMRIVTVLMLPAVASMLTKTLIMPITLFPARLAMIAMITAQLLIRAQWRFAVTVLTTTATTRLMRVVLLLSFAAMAIAQA
jgi:hypothetical protein